MLLAIDIGNSNISFGIFNANKLIRTFNLSASQYSFNRLGKKIGRLKITDTIICSVVPKLTGLFSKDLNKITGKRPYILGKHIQVPIQNRYHNPQQVGQDRLVNAYAGVKLYKAPLILIDYGTAITFDLVSKNKAYIGGLILPGIKISLEALNRRTALLPKIKLAAPKSLIGKDTKNSMLSGIVYGFAALTERLNIKLKKALGSNAKVIATGGNCRLISRYCSGIYRTDPLLTLKGINFIYKSCKQKTS